MDTSTRTRRRLGPLLAGVVALVVAAAPGGTAAAQAGDPIVYDVTPPSQLTTPGTQVQITFTISDLPPCADGDLVTLDSLDFTLTDPSGLSTIVSLSDSESPNSSSTISPSMDAATILFDSAFPCENPPGAPPPQTESISVVVTLNVPAAVPLGTQLSLEGRARGFASPPNEEYAATRTGFVLVAETPPPPPAPPPPAPGDGGTGSDGGAGAGAGSVAGAQRAPAATAVLGTARFTG